MREFLLGVLTCWTVLGSAALISDTLGWRHDDRLWIFLCLPVLVVVTPVVVVWYCLFDHPWRLVIRGVDPTVWETKRGQVKALRILKRFYFCVEKKPVRFYNRCYFVRIREEK